MTTGAFRAFRKLLLGGAFRALSARARGMGQDMRRASWRRIEDQALGRPRGGGGEVERLSAWSIFRWATKSATTTTVKD